MDSTGLFRAEALEARRSHALGSVRLASPWPIRLAAWGSAIACVILGILLYIGQYSKREHASGVLVPSAGLIDVVANHAGVVEKVVVQEGESVSEGQPLLWISNTRINESLQDAEKISAQQLRESRRRLAEDLANQ